MKASRLHLLSAMRCAVVASAALLLSGCADKEFTRPTRFLNPQLSLQVTTVGGGQASQAAGFAPKFLVIAAGYLGSDDIKGLSFKYAPFSTGTSTTTLDVNLAACLADTERPGSRDSCELFVAAALVQDSVPAAQRDTADVFANAFDARIAGPFTVAPGRAPVVPAIDLSASRYGAVRWEGDNALQLGSGHAPISTSQGPVLGLTGPLAGAFVGTAPPVLFSATQGCMVNGGSAQNPQVQCPIPQLAIFENGSWRRVNMTLLGPGAPSFTDIAAVSPTEVYLGHRQGFFKYDGSSITRITAVTDTAWSVGQMSNATTKLVIVGSTNSVWIGNGTTFTRYLTPLNQRWDGVCITGPNEAFASSSTGAGLIRFDGNTWVSVPAPSTAAKLDLQCPAPGVAFVTANNVGFFRWTGQTWQQIPGIPAFVPRRPRMAAVSATEVYAAGDSGLVDRAFYKLTAQGWTEIGRLRLTFASGRPWADPRGGAYYSGSSYGYLNKVTQTSASVISYMPSMRDVWVNSGTSAFVVGNARFISRWDGVKWTVDQPPANKRTLLALNGVWSDGPARAWTVGQQSTIMHWNGNNWTVVTDSANAGGPLGEYFAVWGSGTNAWVAGDQGISQCTVGVGCTLTQGLGGSLYGIWGSAPNNIWAVGASGRILRYNGTSWTPFTSPTSRKLVKVAGSGASDVWAVGDSVLIHFDGTSWTNIPLTGDLQRMQAAVPTALFGQPSIGLFVRSRDEVYLGGPFGDIARWNGTDWDQMNQRFDVRRIVAISIGPTGCGLAVTDAETTPPSPQPNLWRGAGPSGCFLNPMTPPASWP
jgi:hypothetical protein